MKRSFYLSSLLVFCFIVGSVAARAQAPVITTDPVNTTVCSGSEAKFFTAYTGTTTGIVWQVSTDGGTMWDSVHNGPVYSGAMMDTLRVMSSVALSGNMYRAIVFNTPDSSITGAGMLTVDTLNPGTITGPTAICMGNPTTYTNSIAGGTWTNARAAVGSFAGDVYTGAAYGIDTLMYIVTNVCGTDTAMLSIRVDTMISTMPIAGPTATCVGGTISLTNPMAGGTWSVSNSNATISSAGVLTGVAGGFVTASYTLTNACGSFIENYTVQIDTVLAATTISGPATVCVGSAIMLSSAAGGGMWISGSTAYASVDGSGNVTGIAQGTATISYYRANSCGASVAIKTVNVLGGAAVITGLDSVGIGATITLSDTAWGGSWSSSNATIATVDASGVVAGADTGVVTISYSVSNACGTFVATKVINVGPAPFAGVITSSTGKDTVCVGGTNTFTSPGAVAPGVWRLTNPRATVDSLTGLVTGVTKGRDTLIYTVKNAFGTTETRRVIVVQSPKVDSVKGPGLYGVGGSYTLVGYPAGGVWSSSSDSSIVLVGPSTGFIVVVKPGAAKFTYTFGHPSWQCGTDTASLFISVGVTGVNDVNAAAATMSVQPNPSNGTFTMNLESAVNSEMNVTVTNVLGEKVKEFTTTTNRATNVTLDQPAGVYFVTANGAAGKYTTRVVISK